MFADHARINIRSGNGGDGHISFRKEKYVPAGGPDGGNGGDGGDVIFEVDNNMNTLFDYKHRYQFKAGNGTEGDKRRRHGTNGDDLILKVPEGTILREETSGKVIADMSGANKRLVILKGGRGGKGNMNYATSTMQAPQYAQPGKPGIELNLLLELKLVADVGLVGFPNAGKSTLLKAVTHADPKIADYPFTTIDPNLGVVEMGDGRGFVIADMPGLIEGASEGTGLGHEFLRHIQRTRVLIHVVDVSGFEDKDPVEDVKAINNELFRYDPDILKKPMLIAANKIDAISDEKEKSEIINKLRKAFSSEDISVYAISAAAHTGVKELMNAVMLLLDTKAPEPVTYEQEFFPEEISDEELPYTINKTTGPDGKTTYVVEGPKIEKMLGYTNLESERGFAFFQRFLKGSGIEKALKKAGIRQGDTVKMYYHQFDYYDEGDTGIHD